SDDEYNYETINNLLKLRTKEQKCQKHIAAFNDSAQKNNESINVDSTEGIEEQNQMMHKHIQEEKD
ncbi:27781_t:CDS:2, partial [Racocetra persica]